MKYKTFQNFCSKVRYIHIQMCKNGFITDEKYYKLLDMYKFAFWKKYQ